MRATISQGGNEILMRFYELCKIMAYFVVFSHFL